MSVQSLERRRLLSQLIVTGTSSDDAIGLAVASVLGSGLDLKVTNSGKHGIVIKVDYVARALEPGQSVRTSQIKVGGVTAVLGVDLGKGDDSFVADPAVTVPMNVGGGDGNDTLIGGGNADKIDGGAGDDSISGGKGRDVIFGGTGVDSLDGGSGNDTLYGDTADNRNVNASGQDTLFGGVGDDLLVGGRDTDGGASLLGGDGNDTLRASPGGDLYVDGGAGRDSLIGSDAYDELDGGDGNDTLLGNGGNDHLHGGAGDDRLESATGNDTLSGDGGSDTLIGGTGNNLLEGRDLVQTGDDTFAYVDDNAADSAVGNGGNDTFSGGRGDTLVGGAGNDLFDTVYTADRTVTVVPGDGNDTQQVYNELSDGAVDTIAMAPGLENLSVLAGTVGQIVGNDLNNHIVLYPYDAAYLSGNPEGDAAIYGVTVGLVRGGAGNDTIELGLAGENNTGTRQFYVTPTTLDGGAGDDHLIVRDRTRTQATGVYLRGGAGRDTLEADTSGVWADYSDQPGPLRINLATGQGLDNDTLVGPIGVRATGKNDTLTGDAKDNLFDGGGGADEFFGGGGQDTVWYADRTVGVSATIDGRAHSGVAGENDLIHTDVEGLIGTDHADTLTGGPGNDKIVGLLGDDLIHGGAGDDTLTGNASTVIFGLFDADINAGNDTLIGDGGSDTAAFPTFVGASGTAGVLVTLDGRANDGVVTLDFGDGSAPATDVPSAGDVETENVDGADTVYGDNGPNRLTRVGKYANGGAGDDTLVAAASEIVGQFVSDHTSDATLDGGLGADTLQGAFITYADRTRGVSASFDGVANDGAPGEGDNLIPVYADRDQPIAATLIGTAYDDSLVGGDGRDILVGLAGNDTLDGRGGDDLLYGGDAPGTTDDTLTGPDGADRFVGGDGDDTVSYGLRGDDLRLTFDGLANDGGRGEGDNLGDDVENLIGGRGDDYMAASAAAGAGGKGFVGGAGADTFVGGAGNDSVRYDPVVLDSPIGLRENFSIVSGPVNVTLDGRANDGQAGEDDDVAAGIDRVVGTTDADTLTAGDAPATLVGGGGADRLVGGPSDDTLQLGGASAFGGDGNDLFINQNGSPDTIDGGDGLDSVQDDDTDPAAAGVQNDTFANVEFTYDALGTPAASAAVTGDTLSVAANAPAAVSRLARVAADSAALVVSGVSISLDAKKVLRLTGSSGNDTIEVSQSGTTISVFIGGAKKASATYAATAIEHVEINAAGGNDTVRLDNASGTAALQKYGIVRGGDGNDTITGGDKADFLGGEAGNDAVNGGRGNDILTGDYLILQGQSVPKAARLPDGNDVINGGGGTDLVSYTARTGSVTIDLTRGSETATGETDRLTGIEQAVGSQTADTLGGSANNDTLFGGPGDDRLTGGAGADELDAGEGSDFIDPGTGADRIDSGQTETVVDRIVASLDSKGNNPKSATGVLLLAGGSVFNGKDYFTLSGRYFGQGT